MDSAVEDGVPEEIVERCGGAFKLPCPISEWKSRGEHGRRRKGSGGLDSSYPTPYDFSVFGSTCTE